MEKEYLKISDTLKIEIVRNDNSDDELVKLDDVKRLFYILYLRLKNLDDIVQGFDEDIINKIFNK